MSRKLYTADLHFGHDKIIEYCKRPFETVEEMDNTLIENWNAKVGKNDLVYIVGDFTLKSTKHYANFVERLNGNKYLVLGNHDRPHPEGFEMIKQYHSVKDSGYRIILFHWAIENWQGRFAKDQQGNKTVLHFHGHSHGLSLVRENRFDVGVDCWDYAPVTLEEILDSKNKNFMCTKSTPCWCYEMMTEDEFTFEDINDVCRKCKYYVKTSII